MLVFSLSSEGVRTCVQARLPVVERLVLPMEMLPEVSTREPWLSVRVPLLRLAAVTEPVVLTLAPERLRAPLLS